MKDNSGESDSTRISDKAVIAATGHGWTYWVSFLDKKVDGQANHSDIVKILSNQQVSPWWAQTLAGHFEREALVGHFEREALVGHFEREALGRNSHEMPDGYQASASKTINVSAMTIFESFSGGEADWLPGGRIEPSTINPPTDLKDGQLIGALRGSWTGSAMGQIVVYLTRKADNKSVISINHIKLANAQLCEAQKTAWRKALADLKGILEK